MKSIVSSLISVALVFFFYQNTWANDEPQPNTAQPALTANANALQGTGAVKGQITWAKDGSPVANAIWQLDYISDPNGVHSISHITDETGKFYLEGLESGKYGIRLPGAVRRDKRVTFIYKVKQCGDITIRENATTEVNYSVDEGGAFSGRVTHQNTGLPIENAVIRLYDRYWWEDKSHRSTTDSSGYFYIGGLEEDFNYHIQASGEIGENLGLGYIREGFKKLLNGEYYQETADSSQARLVMVDGKKTGLNFTLTGTAVMGHVKRADNGEPINRTHITLFNKDWNGITSAATDSGGTGFYFFDSVTPGNYFLEADGYCEDENQILYLPLCYENAKTREQASLLPISDEVKTINFNMVSGAHIQGNIKRQDNGQPIADARVCLFDATWTNLGDYSTDNDGNYSITLYPGDYYLEADGWGNFNGSYQKAYNNEYYRESPDQAGALLVHVTGDVNDINFTLEKTLGIRGKITKEQDGNPIQDAEVTMYNENWDWVQETKSDQNGNYFFTNFDYTKKYYVEATGKIWWNDDTYGDWKQEYTDIYYNNVNERAQATLLETQNPLTDINFSLKNGTFIKGNIKRQDTEEPIAHTRLFLFDSTWTFLREGFTDDNGDYSMIANPGDYYLEAMGWCETEAGNLKLYQSEYFRESPDQAGAVLIHVSGDVNDINFTLEVPVQLGISGKIIKEQDGSPIQETQVIIYNENWDWVQETRTDQNGNYYFTNFDYTKKYYVEATGKIWWNDETNDGWKQEYNGIYYNNVNEREQATLLETQNPLTDINFSLKNGIFIKGNIKRQDNAEPIARTRLFLFDSTWTFLREGFTDVNGDYSMIADPGNYYLEAMGWCETEVGNLKLYQCEYYRESSDQAGALLIHVTGDTNNINFTLEGTLFITGRITREQEGSPIQEAQVIAYNENWDIVQDARTNQFGVFCLIDLDSTKSYYIEATGRIWWNFGTYSDWGQVFNGEFYHHVSSREQAELLKIRNPLTNLNFSLDKIADVNRNEKSKLPDQFQLYQNHPNPFNSSTVIQYDLPSHDHVQVIIYDLMGRHIKTIVDTQQRAGRHEAVWDGMDEHHISITTGIYFCRLLTKEYAKVIKIAIVK